MRTLKKVLALTLALATLFSLTAFAAYKDESKIDPDVMSAVNLVSSLKIMMGDENGFRPTDTIKRSEAAKMVYVLRTGGKTDADGWKGQNLFTDMKGHWAEGYVNYCASVGIIAGVGNKKFNPNGNVTGVELAKMLLVAAGYKADIQGYAGTQWANKVLADAESVGMFDGYDAAYMAAAPRQYAAQMFANALLRTNMAVYLSGELVTGIVANPVLVGTKYFGLLTVSGELTTAGKSFGLNPVLTLPVGVTLKEFNAPADLLYQDVRLVVNGKTGEVYDMYASGKSKVFNVKGSDVKLTEKVAKGVSATEEYTLELPGYEKTTYKATAVNTDITVVFDKTSGTAATDTMPTIEAALTNNNDTFRFIDTDGNGKFERVMMFDGAYGKVSKNSTTDGFVTRNSANNADVVNVSKDNYSKVNFVDSVVKDDIAYSYKDMAGTVCVKKVEPVKGVYTAKSGETYTLGGSKYEFAANPYNNTPPSSFGTEYNVYTDGVYAVAISAPEAAEVGAFDANLCYVIEGLNKSTGLTGAATAKVDVLLATGDRKVFEYAQADSSYVKDSEVKTAEGKVMQYVIKDGKISFKAVVAPTGGTYDDTIASMTYTKSSTLVDLDGAKIRTSADTYFFVKHSTSKYAVVKASELSSFTGATAANSKFGYVTTKGIATMAFGFVDFTTNSIPGTTVSDKLAVVTGQYTESYDAANKTTVITVPVLYMDGTKGDLVLAAAPAADAIGGTDGKVGLVGYDVAANGKATLKAHGQSSAGKLNGVADTFVKLGDNYVDFAANYTVIYLNANGKVVADGKLYVKDSANSANNFDCFALTKDSKITTLIVTGYVAE